MPDWASLPPAEARWFPWPEVAAAIAAADGQIAAAATAAAQEEFAADACACPTCGRPPPALRWVSIGASEEAWIAGDERCGWLTLCDRCRRQIDFFVDEVMVELRRDGNW